MSVVEGSLVLREFAPGDAVAFRQLNEEWICRYFKLEPHDEHALLHPQETILDRGGRIFLAVLDGVTVGCCALLAMEPGAYEVAKMAVAPASRGVGVGRYLLTHVIAAARNSGARRLFLETNHILTPAIALYTSLGFERLAPERIAPSVYARADVAMELWLA